MLYDWRYAVYREGNYVSSWTADELDAAKGLCDKLVSDIDWPFDRGPSAWSFVLDNESIEIVYKARRK